jgi:hypothetical protein
VGDVVPEKIAMTVPVTEEFKTDGMRMTFYMPSKYTLPVPEDARIRFNVLPVSVLRLSASPACPERVRLLSTPSFCERLSTEIN